MLEHIVPATHFIVRTQVTKTLKMADYVRVDDLDTAVACARSLVDTGRVYAAEVREDSVRYRLMLSVTADDHEKSP